MERQVQTHSPPQGGTKAPGSNFSNTIIPEEFKSVFKFNQFNSMQTAALDAIFNSSDNVVVSSPTGSGKTVLFEIAIVRLLSKKRSGDTSLLNCKVLYIAPTKALCSEKYTDWCSKFSNLGVSVGILTSDTGAADTWRVKQSDILICTPEKWDVLTRRWFDYKRLLELVKLICIDEIHVLNSDRGATLEVVTTRMKTLCSSVRILALSATIPNLEDVALWLRKHTDVMTPATALEFGEEHRAVRLDKIVNGYSSFCSNDFMFDKYLNSKLIECINTFSKSKPTLIFCPTRASCTQTVNFLYQNLRGFHSTCSVILTGNKELDLYMQKGVAYHHAGLSFEQRRIVEENFKNGSLQLLCSTSTLAVGVNLPAYCVIIKGTKSWSNTGLQEYSILEILQIMGRAGRPQFETSGVAVLMTQQKDKYRYDKFIHGKEKLESCLHKNLIENLTAEIVLGTITSVESAVRWLKSTFFYTRYISSPTSYPEVEASVGMVSSNLTGRLFEFCEKNLELLVKEELVSKHNGAYQGTKYGQAMSQHYVLFKTMTLWMHWKSPAGIKEVLELLCNSFEFLDVRLRHNEKRLLKDINKRIRYPISDKNIEKTAQKVSIMIQFELGCLDYPSHDESKNLHTSFLADKMTILKQAPRLLRCMIDIFVKRESSGSLLAAFELLRCINGRCWEGTAMELQQIDGVGPVSVRKLSSHGVYTLQKAMTLTAQQLEQFMGTKSGGTTKIKKDIDSLPRLELEVRILASRATVDGLIIDIQFEIESNSITYTFRGKPLCVSILTSTTHGTLIDFRRIFLRKLEGSKRATIRTRIRSPKEIILVDAFFEEIAGIQAHSSVDTVRLKGWEAVVQAHLDNDDLSDDSEMDKFSMDKFSMEASYSNANRTLPTQESDISLEKMPLRGHDMIECHHICKDKTKCRHLCCNNGILCSKNSLDGAECKHKCKDKANCGHICCNKWVPHSPKQSSVHDKKTRRGDINSLSDNLNFITKRSLSSSDSEEDIVGIKFLDPQVQATLMKKRKIDGDISLKSTVTNTSAALGPSSVENNLAEVPVTSSSALR